MATKVKADVRRRREEAESRQSAHNAQPDSVKLANLDSRPGKCLRERARLMKRIADAKREK